LYQKPSFGQQITPQEVQTCSIRCILIVGAHVSQVGAQVGAQVGSLGQTLQSALAFAPKAIVPKITNVVNFFIISSNWLKLSHFIFFIIFKNKDR